MEQTHDSDSTLSSKISEKNMSRSSNKSRKTTSAKKSKKNIKNQKKSLINSDSEATNSDVEETSNINSKKIKKSNVKISEKKKLNHKSLFEINRNVSSEDENDDDDDNNSQDLLMNADLQEPEGDFSIVPDTQNYLEQKSDTSIQDISVPDTPEKEDEASEVDNYNGNNTADAVDGSGMKDMGLAGKARNQTLCNEDDNHVDKQFSLSDTFDIDNSALNKAIGETIDQMNLSLADKKNIKHEKNNSKLSFKEDYNEKDDVEGCGEVDKNFIPTQIFTSNLSNDTFDMAKIDVDNSKNDSDNNNLLTQFFNNDNSPVDKAKRKSNNEIDTTDLVYKKTGNDSMEKVNDSVENVEDENNKSTMSKKSSNNVETSINDLTTDNSNNHKQKNENKGDEAEDTSLKLNETKSELTDCVFKLSYKRRSKKSLGLSTSTPFSKASPSTFSSSICSKSAFKIPDMNLDDGLKYNKGRASGNVSFSGYSSEEKKASKRSFQHDADETSIGKVEKMNMEETFEDSRSSLKSSGKKRLISLDSGKKRLLSQNEWDQFGVKNQPSQEERQFISQFKDSPTSDVKFLNNGVQEIMPNAFSNITSRKSVKIPVGKNKKLKVFDVCSSDEEIGYSSMKRKSKTKGKRFSTFQAKEIVDKNDTKRSKSDSACMFADKKTEACVVGDKETDVETNKDFKNIEGSQKKSKVNTYRNKNDENTPLVVASNENAKEKHETKNGEIKPKKPRMSRKSHISKKEAIEENEIEGKKQSIAVDSLLNSTKNEKSIRKKKLKKITSNDIKEDKESGKITDVGITKEHVFNDGLNEIAVDVGENNLKKDNNLNEKLKSNKKYNLNKTLKNAEENDKIETIKNECILETKASKRASKRRTKRGKVEDTSAIKSSKDENCIKDDTKSNDSKQLSKKESKSKRGRKKNTDIGSNGESGVAQTNGQDNDVDNTLASESSLASRNNITLRGRKRHLKILFTGLDKDKGMKIVKKLGGMVVEVVKGCTHIVTTDTLKRTIKLLCGVAMGVPIVRFQWLSDSMDALEFVDHTNYLLKDTENEAKYGFLMEESLQKASQTPLFSGLCFHVTKSVKVPDLNEVIIAANGKVLKTQPTKRHLASLYLISCPEDLSFCAALALKLDAELKVVTSEFVLTGALRQQLAYHEFKLDGATTTTTEACNNVLDVSMRHEPTALAEAVNKASKSNKTESATLKRNGSVISEKNTKKKSIKETTDKKKHDETLKEDDKKAANKKISLVKNKQKSQDGIKQNKNTKRTVSSCSENVENIENAKPRRKNKL